MMVWTNVSSAEYVLLRNGSVIDASIGSYTAVMDGWFVVALFLFTIFLLYMGTKDEGVASWFTLVGTGLLLFLLPNKIHWILYIIGALSLGIVLFKTFFGSDP